MSEVPVQLMVAAFQDEKAADEALKQLKEAKKEHLIKIQDAAVLRKDEKGKVHIKETEDVGAGKGAIAGGILGVAIAALTGPVGIVLAGVTGALVGGIAAKNIDMGIDNDRLKKLADSLKPGTSAIIAIVEHTWVADLEAAMQEAGADVLTENLSAEISAQLEAGREVAMTAIATEGATEFAETTTGEGVTTLEDIVVTDDGFEASAAVVTEDGVAVKDVVVTADGMAASEAVLTKEGGVAHGVIATEEGTVEGFAVMESEEEEEKKEK